MKNLQQFSAKVQYVTPSCKSVELKARQAILSASNDGYGRSGEAGQDGEYDENDRWNF